MSRTQQSIEHHIAATRYIEQGQTELNAMPLIPQRSLADGMPYTPSVATDIRETWERYGFRATTEAERMKRNAHLRRHS
jgi:hypothetical protein